MHMICMSQWQRGHFLCAAFENEDDEEQYLKADVPLTVHL